MNRLDLYGEIVGKDVLDQLRQLASLLEGLKVVHVNSTRTGGGVAEILERLVPLMQEVGIETSWLVIQGDEDFFLYTKAFHNALQGMPVGITDTALRHYEEVNAENALGLREELERADIVIVHDPQPAALIEHFPNRKGKWVWRCHIDLSRPWRPVWKYLRQFILKYDASIFSLADFAQPLPHPLYIIPPSIDPLSDKNRDLSPGEVEAVLEDFGIDPRRPLLVQISRFDRFKDPLGVIQAYKLAKKFIPSLQLVLAGGPASDDPEGEAVYREVKLSVGDDPDAFILMLQPKADLTVNALQRGATIVLQKSLKEGFGLTVTEALWKGKPVIGGDTGGIRLQVINHHTGFRVHTPEGAALRIRYLLTHPEILKAMGKKAREFVRDNFLLTRHLRDYLTLMIALIYEVKGRIEIGKR